MLLWLSGPTGSGKSSLADLCGRFGATIVREELPTELFRAFTLDPPRHCAPLQDAIMRSRRRLWDGLAAGRTVIFDRSIEEDAAIFCRLHHERGLIGDAEYAELKALAGRLTTDIPKPSLIVYLNPGLRVLRERLAHEGHPETIVAGLPRQVELYEEWMATCDESVLRIDNGSCARDALPRLLEVRC